MKFTYHFRSDPGRVRELNEDSGSITRPEQADLLAKRGELLVVADGMGGHEFGEVASNQAVETVNEFYYRIEGDAETALKQSIEQANAVIFQRSRREGRQGMGTTIVAAARVGNQVHLAHVGDSRIYLVRKGQIQPLTRDHSPVADQVAAGIITPDEAARHPHRNVVSRAVGTGPTVEVEISSMSPLPLREGDVLILCSDGLTEHVKPDRIQQLVQNRTPESATEALIEAANAGGGTDNISVIVAQVGDLAGDASLTAPMAAASTAAPGSTKTAPFKAQAAAPGVPGRARAIPTERSLGRNPLPAFLLAAVLVTMLGAGGYFFWNSLGEATPTAVPTTTPLNNFILNQTPSPTLSVEASPTVTATQRATTTPVPTPANTPTASGSSSAPVVQATLPAVPTRGPLTNEPPSGQPGLRATVPPVRPGP